MSLLGILKSAAFTVHRFYATREYVVFHICVNLLPLPFRDSKLCQELQNIQRSSLAKIFSQRLDYGLRSGSGNMGLHTYFYTIVEYNTFTSTQV
jgi:hypothetical protein